MKALIGKLLILQIVFSTLLASGVSSAQNILITDLGTLGGDYGEATAVNDLGQVVGRSNTVSTYSHAFIWTAAGGMVDLGTLGGNTKATAVNDLGQVVGGSETNSGYRHAFSWTSAGGMVDLGTLGGGYGEATAVNDLGQVVGWSYTASGGRHAFSWTSAGGMVDLGTLGGDSSVPTAVNNLGQVVGWSYNFSEQGGRDFRAFIWTSAAGMVDLGTLPGGFHSVPTAVNDLGQIVGYSTIASGGPTHAFIWTSAGGMVDLGTRPGSSHSKAAAVNDLGQVVGWSYDLCGIDFDPDRLPCDFRAFIWTSAGGMVDLGALGGVESSATAVNNLGQVAGWSETASGERRPTVWTVNEGHGGGDDGGGGSCFIETLGQDTMKGGATALLAALGVAVFLLATRVRRAP